LVGQHVLHVTKTQSSKIKKCKSEGVGLVLKLSAAQVKHNVVNGGFLGAILPFLASAAKTVVPALLGGLAFSGMGKAVDAIDRKAQGQGMPKTLYLKKDNKAFKITKAGEGLYLQPWKKGDSIRGDGVYLKAPTGMGYVNGKGFITGTTAENSPVAKIPLLGSLLSWLI